MIKGQHSVRVLYHSGQVVWQRHTTLTHACLHSCTHLFLFIYLFIFYRSKIERDYGDSLIKLAKNTSGVSEIG